MGRRHRKSSGTKGRQAGRRPRWLWMGCIGAALLAGGITWLALPDRSPLADASRYQGGPRLAVDRQEVDFGRVPFEKSVQARFRLKNVGDQPLRLATGPRVEVVEGC